MCKLEKFLLLTSFCLVLSNCASQDEDLPITAVPPSAQPGSGSFSAGVNTGTVNGNAVTGQEQGAPQQRRNDLGVLIDEFGMPTTSIFYFDFDRSSIQPEDIDILASHGQYIASSPGARVRLEGHTDERGTREYNIALGENRAKSIERILQLQGVRNDQVSIISLGEEQPAVMGHNESSWTQNRRVEIIYENR